MDELVDTIVPGGWGFALGIGLGVALLATRGFRPLAKQAVKGYLAASDQIQRMTSGARNELQDIYFEAKAEREHGAEPRPAGTGTHT